MFPGFVSEFAKLGRDKRRDLGRMFVTGTIGRSGVQSVLSVPDHATRVAGEEAEWAVEQGADGINLLHPFFLSPSRTEILEHLRCILAAVLDTPIIIQLAPGLTGSAIAPDDLVSLADDHNNLAAVKVEAMPPGRTASQFTELEPRLPCLVGFAGLYLPDSLARGAVGLQPGCSSIELYHRLWTLWEGVTSMGSTTYIAVWLPTFWTGYRMPSWWCRSRRPCR